MSSLVYTFFSRSGRTTVPDGTLDAVAGLSSPDAKAGFAITQGRTAARTAEKKETARIELRMDVPPSLSSGSIACGPNACKYGPVAAEPIATPWLRGQAMAASRSLMRRGQSDFGSHRTR